MSGRPGGVPRPGRCEFPPQIARIAFGEDRLADVLSGISPNTRTKYIGPWRRCGGLRKLTRHGTVDHPYFPGLGRCLDRFYTVWNQGYGQLTERREGGIPRYPVSAPPYRFPDFSIGWGGIIKF